MKFRKLPIIIEAVQWDGKQLNETPKWIGEALTKEGTPDTTPGTLFRRGDKIHIGTLDSVAIANPGDWIIRGINGELYPCAGDIFPQTFEPVLDSENADVEPPRERKANGQ